MALWYKRQNADKTLVNIEKIYVYASELITFLHFTFKNCYFFQYFIGISETLSVQMTYLAAYMYRQISKCTDKTPKKHYWGGGGGGGQVPSNYCTGTPIFKFLKIWRKELLKNYKEMEDQINANKIFHSSAIYIQSMKITRSLCKQLLMIKCVTCFFLTPSITPHIHFCILLKYISSFIVRLIYIYITKY